MYTDTEGIILKQINTVNGRRMLRLFSRKFGKISAGTGISEKSRSKAGLAMRPFTYGMYELYKGRGTYNINSAETIRSYYGIGNSVDKYMNASFMLELLDRITVEDHSSPQLFNLTLAFLSAIENRKKAFGTLVIAYELKMLKLLGLEPQLYNCTVCGKDLSDMTERKTTGKELFFNIKEGGLVCRKCTLAFNDETRAQLIYSLNTGIVDILKYFLNNPIKSVEKLGLDELMFQEIQMFVKAYMDYHLDIGKLKSEDFIGDS